MPTGSSESSHEFVSGEGFAMMPESSFEKEHPEGSTVQSRWQENHGNLLMAFVAGIVLVGSILLIYRQNRFVPPRFPDSAMIVVPEKGSGELAADLRPEDLVTIQVTGAANDTGTIKIAIYESEATFNNPGQAYATNSLPLQDGEAIWIVPASALPRRIAIAAFHDEDENEQLTLNRFGIPSERYGFTRDARGLTGPPSFQESAIERPKGGDTLSISIR